MELEIQNQALRYSQEWLRVIERFVALFSNVPLALMVVDENGLVLESNAMALRVFRPMEHDPPLNFLLPLVRAEHVDKVAHAFTTAKSLGTSETTEVVFSCGSSGIFTGDLHIARIENSQDELAHFICALIDQGPLLTQRRALQTSACSVAGTQWKSCNSARIGWPPSSTHRWMRLFASTKITSSPYSTRLQQHFSNAHTSPGLGQSA